RCQIIARYGIGVDTIDLDAATQAGIIVTNNPTYCIEEVAEHTMALLLACARKVALYDRLVRGSRWEGPPGQPVFPLAGGAAGLGEVRGGGAHGGLGRLGEHRRGGRGAGGRVRPARPLLRPAGAGGAVPRSRREEGIRRAARGVGPRLPAPAARRRDARHDER